MAIKITLTANTQTGEGVDFNADFAAFFNGFTPFGFPQFLGPNGSEETTQIVHLDTPVSGQEDQTRAVVLNGDDFLYTFSNHTVSGVIRSVQLVTLGDAYDNGDLVLEGGLLSDDTNGLISFSNLNITNPVAVDGRVHKIVKGMMGGGPDGNKANPAALEKEIWAKAHILVGSTGDERYLGSKFGDQARGNGGDDHLNGRGGHDTVTGGAGDDRLIGAAGHDRLVAGAGGDILSGGKGADRFVFAGLDDESAHIITDFRSGQKDRIDLRGIDADTAQAGDQKFSFKGETDFTAKAGELILSKVGVNLLLQGDVDGDDQADFSITLNNLASLRAADLFL